MSRGPKPLQMFIHCGDESDAPRKIDGQREIGQRNGSVIGHGSGAYPSTNG